MSAFELPVKADTALRLCEVRLAEPYHAMIERNQERLARWERWAEEPSSLEATKAWLEERMVAFARGTQVPTVIVVGGQVVGSVGSVIDSYVGSASIGFWVDAASEGKGFVFASARTLITYVFENYGVARFELRTAVDNLRSQAVAQRLGFTLDGTLRSAMPRGDTVVDQCVYTLLPDELTDPS